MFFFIKYVLITPLMSAYIVSYMACIVNSIEKAHQELKTR
jgi:hypothetical protein